MKKKDVELPIATIALVILSAIFYFVLSGGSTYVTPLSKLYPLGVSGRNLFGSITYSFVHIGLKHLIGNVIALAGFGLLLEEKVDKSRVLGIFMVSGVLGGLAYSLLNPNVWVVGGSTAIAGLLAASMVANTKKSLIVFVGVMLLVPNVIMPVVDGALDSLEEGKLIDAAGTKLGISQLEGMIEKGNYTNETLAEKALLEEQFRALLESRRSLSEGRDTEDSTPASLQIHLIGGFFALAFLWVFDRRVLKDFWRRVRVFVKS